MKSRDVLRIQPEGSEVEVAGSESVRQVRNPGANMEVVDVLLSSDRLRATADSALFRQNVTFGLLEHNIRE